MWSSVPAAHPRERGEKKLSPHFPSPLVGSPPQTWGKAEVPVGAGLPSGLTPASAGKNFELSRSEFRPTDHPRGCGEKLSLQSCHFVEIGSPPRVRGKAATEKRATEIPRITPAGAGKRKSGYRVLSPSQDHPRGCGEKLLDDCVCTLSGGSPPRVRGKGRLWEVRRMRGRITPAGAGKRHCLAGNR